MGVFRVEFSRFTGWGGFRRGLFDYKFSAAPDGNGTVLEWDRKKWRKKLENLWLMSIVAIGLKRFFLPWKPGHILPFQVRWK